MYSTGQVAGMANRTATLLPQCDNDDGEELLRLKQLQPASLIDDFFFYIFY